MIDGDLPQHPRGLKSPEGDPEGVLDLWVEDNRWTCRQPEYKRSHDNGWERGRSGMQVVENAKRLGTGEIDTNFLQRFADRGGAKVHVASLAAPAGERDLARPCIAGADGAMNEQRLDAFVAVVQNHGHCGGNHPGLKWNLNRLVLTQLEPCILNSGHQIPNP